MKRAGFDGHLTTPIDPHTFVAELEEFLAGDARPTSSAGKKQRAGPAMASL